METLEDRCIGHQFVDNLVVDTTSPLEGLVGLGREDEVQRRTRARTSTEGDMEKAAIRKDNGKVRDLNAGDAFRCLVGKILAQQLGRIQNCD